MWGGWAGEGFGPQGSIDNLWQLTFDSSHSCFVEDLDHTGRVNPTQGCLQHQNSSWPMQLARSGRFSGQISLSQAALLRRGLVAFRAMLPARSCYDCGPRPSARPGCCISPR